MGFEPTQLGNKKKQKERDKFLGEHKSQLILKQKRTGKHPGLF